MDVCAKLVGVRRIQLYVVPGRYRDAVHPDSRQCGRGYQRKTEGPDRPGRRELQIPLGRASRREILNSLSLSLSLSLSSKLKAPASSGAFYCERIVSRRARPPAARLVSEKKKEQAGSSKHEPSIKCVEGKP